MSSVDDLKRKATSKENGLTRRDQPESGRRHKLITFTRNGEIDWAAMESLIDKAEDFPTLKDYRDELLLLRRWAELRGGAIRTTNAIVRYIYRIDERRWEIKQRLITRGGSVHKATLPDLGLNKRDSQILDQKHSIPKEKCERYFAECDRNSREATEAGLLRLAAVEKPPAPAVPPGKYGLILADPAWKHDCHHGYFISSKIPYPVMTEDEIVATAPQIDRLAAKDCTLFLWVPACLLDVALRVIEAWRFEYHTHWVWHKADRKNPGHYGRADHEDLIIAGRGKCTPTVDPKAVFSVSSVQSFPRRGLQHSEKPVEYYELIERLYPGVKKIELFARKRRAGWASWGNETNVNRTA